MALVRIFFTVLGLTSLFRGVLSCTADADNQSHPRIVFFLFCVNLAALNLYPCCRLLDLSRSSALTSLSQSDTILG
ncbi:hypothetical protein EV363DRAFT_1415857, partial [Boletus edulis]